MVALDDPVAAAQASGKRADPGKGGAVRGLAWVCASPAHLAIVLASGIFLVWDVKSAPIPRLHRVALPAPVSTVMAGAVNYSDAGFGMCGSQLPPGVMHEILCDEVLAQRSEVERSPSRSPFQHMDHGE